MADDDDDDDDDDAMSLNRSEMGTKNAKEMIDTNRN